MRDASVMSSANLSTEAVISIAFGIPMLLIGLISLWTTLRQANRIPGTAFQSFCTGKETYTPVGKDEEQANVSGHNLSGLQLRSLSTASTLVEDPPCVEENVNGNRSSPATREALDEPQPGILETTSINTLPPRPRESTTLSSKQLRQHDASPSGATASEACDVKARFEEEVDSKPLS